MSNTQFAFIDEKDIPTREQLQTIINKLGYDLILDPELSLKNDQGFSPCILNGEADVGFELFCELTRDVVEDDQEFEEMSNGKDTCITMSWGGDFKDCSSVLIVSYALMKEFGAITTYEGEELDTLISLESGINEALEEIKKEETDNKNAPPKTTYAQLRNICAEHGFTKELENLGFHLGPNELWFYRHRGNYLDLIMFWVSSSNRYMTVPIDCQKVELIDHCDMNNFPKDFMNQYGLNSDCFIDDEDLSFAGWDWEIETENEVKISISEILKLIKSHAEKWFQNITSDEKMFYSYSLRMQESEPGLKLKKELGII